MQLTTIQATVFKLRPLQSSVLPNEQKVTIREGEKFAVHSWAQERDHLRVAFKDQSWQGKNTWYVFAGHCQITDNSKVIHPPPTPAVIKLAVPYKSQRDNENNPDGSCNVTCAAMCLDFLGLPVNGGYRQLEDWLYTKMLSMGLSRHNPWDIATMIEAVGGEFGIRDRFESHATMTQLKAHLAAGKPAITHGYFTAFGHIVCPVGYDSKGFFVHDPYGEWNSWGYDRNAAGTHDEKGKFIHYSYDLIRQVCVGSDQSFWVHFVEKV